jgi:PGF-CTERM protein
MQKTAKLQASRNRPGRSFATVLLAGLLLVAPLTGVVVAGGGAAATGDGGGVTVAGVEARPGGVTVTPTTVEAGRVLGGDETLAVTLRNDGDAVALLPTTLAVRNATGTVVPDAATTNVTGDTVWLEPGERATVGVTLAADAPADRYTATLRFGDRGTPPGERRSVDLAWAAGLAALSVEKEPTSGGPGAVAGDRVRVLAADGSVARDTRLGGNGSARVVLPTGDYTVESAGTATTGQPTLLAERVALTRDATVTLSERETVAYRLDDADLPADLRTLGATASLGGGATPPLHVAAGPGVDSVLVGEGVGRSVTVGFVGVPATGSAAPAAGEAYHLVARTDGVDGPVSVRPNPADLRTVTVDRYGPRRTATAFRTARGGASDPPAVTVPAGDRSRLRLHATPGVALRYGIDARGDEGHRWGGLRGPALSTAANRTVTVGEPPFTGTGTWRYDRHYARVVYDGSALRDQGTTRATVTGLEGRVTLTRDGERLVDRPLAADGRVHLNRSHVGGASYRLAVRVTGDGRPHGTTTLAATDRNDGDGVPPAVTRVDLPDLAPGGTLPAATVPLRVETTDPGEWASGVAAVTVRYAPGDVRTPAWRDGEPTDAWTTATVSGTTDARATLPLGEFDADRLSLAVRVTDADGNRVTHHAYDAVGVTEDTLAVRLSPATVERGNRTTATLTRGGSPVVGSVRLGNTTVATGRDGRAVLPPATPGSHPVVGTVRRANGTVVTAATTLRVRAVETGGGVDEGAGGDDGDAGGGEGTVGDDEDAGEDDETTRGGGTDGGSAGGGNSGGGGGGAPVPPAAVTDVRTTDAGALLSARAVQADRLVRSVVPGVAASNVTLDQVDFRLAVEDARFTARFAGRDTAPAPAPPLPGAVGYVRVRTESLRPAQVETVRVRLSVPREVVEEAGGAPAAVAVYRFDGTAWRPVETRAVAPGTYLAVAPAFETLSVRVVSAREAATEASPAGSADRSTPRSDGAEPSADARGATPETPTRTPTTSGDATDEGDAAVSTEGPGFGPVAALVALWVVAALARRRGR